MGRSGEMNLSLYSIRTLACICVILIHAPLPGAVGAIATMTSRWAVPFFFITSGYFAYGAGKVTLKRRSAKTFNLCVKWLALYVCLNAAILICQGRGGLQLANMCDIENWALFLICNWVTPFAGCGHLWYVFAMLYVYAVFSRIEAGKWVSKIPYIVGAAFFFDWCFQAVNVFMELELTNVLWRNWLFEGLPMFLLGYWIAWKNESGGRLCRLEELWC